jgi:hypothetical protein
MVQQRKRVLLLLSFFLLLVIITVSVLSVNLTSTSGSFQIAKGADLIWEKNYGGLGDDRCFYLANAENGYVIVGSSTSFGQGETSAWVLRLNQGGNVVWNRTFSEGFGSEFRYVTGLDDGFLLVGNIFLSSGGTSGYAIKIDNDGNPLWDVTLEAGSGVNKLFSATKAQDGFMLVGLTESADSGSSQVCLVKISFDGKVIWNKVYGDSVDFAGRGVALTQDGCYLVAGYTNSIGNGDYDFLALKIDASGKLLWNRTYGGVESDKAYAVASALDGCVIVGDTRSQGSGDSDAWIVKIDLEGNLVWEKAFGGLDFDTPTCITLLSDGSYAVGGITFSFGNGMRDFWLFKVDSTGKVLWSCTVGRSNYEEAYAVVQDTENFERFVMVGWTNSLGEGRYNFYVVNIKANA